MTYSAYVATTDNIDKSTISREELQALSNHSNSQVTETGTPPADPQAQVKQLSNNLVEDYFNINVLNYSRVPRGSEADRWAAAGLSRHILKDSEYDSNFNKARVDGAREEQTGRVNGFLSQVRDVHVESEIPVLERWVAALTKSLNDNGGDDGDGDGQDTTDGSGGTDTLPNFEPGEEPLWGDGGENDPLWGDVVTPADDPFGGNDPLWGSANDSVLSNPYDPSAVDIGIGNDSSIVG